MKVLVVLAVTILAAAMPARAQSGDDYGTGYNDGYNDAYPATGMPDPSSQYGMGFQEGQDDADFDDETERRALERFGGETVKPQIHGEDATGLGREPPNPEPGVLGNDR